MANNDHKLNLEENSTYRVAYDLMNQIASYEGKTFDNPDEARQYFFDLYYQAIRVVYNEYSYDEIVAKQKSKPSGYPISVGMQW